MPDFTTVLQKDGKPITLVFKDFALLPSEVSRKWRGRAEMQLWAGIEWGLTSPATWPLPEPVAAVEAPVDQVEGDVPAEPAPAPVAKPAGKNAVDGGLFDGIPIRTVMKIHSDWQEAADVTTGE